MTAGSTVAGEAVAARRTVEPVDLLPLGVDVTVFRPAATPSTTPTILFVGSLEPVKDPAALLRAFARLVTDRP